MIPSCLESINAQKNLLLRALAKHVTAGSSYAIVDFPNYGNVGDSAIWLGELALLRELTGRPPAYICDRDSYDEAELRSVIHDGPIFLQGGGNFGDLYPTHQILRHKVIAAFTDREVIQLPQSIFFSDQRAARETANLIKVHPRFRMMVRDRPSHDWALENFSCPTVLAPDCAFGLGPLRRRGQPSQPALYLLRNDNEQRTNVRAEAIAILPNLVHDWKVEPDKDLRTQIKWQAIARSGLTGSFSRLARRQVVSDLSATIRMGRGLKLLSSGRYILTDRLHGHIMSVLLGIPHVVIDNSYGKIGAYVDAWTAGSGVVQKAESLTEALLALKQLERRQEGSTALGDGIR